MGQAKLAGHKITHRDEINGRTIAPSLSLDCAEHAVEALHKRVGQSPFPVGQDAGQVVLHHLRHLNHRTENVGLVKPGHTSHPAAPNLKALLGHAGVGTAIDVLQDTRIW